MPNKKDTECSKPGATFSPLYSANPFPISFRVYSSLFIIFVTLITSSCQILRLYPSSSLGLISSYASSVNIHLLTLSPPIHKLSIKLSANLGTGPAGFVGFPQAQLKIQASGSSIPNMASIAIQLTV